MKKHPNAPPEKGEKRKKQLRVTQEEADMIRQLKNTGLLQKEIAQKLQRSEFSVNHVLSNPDKKYPPRKVPVASNPSKYDIKEFPEDDFSRYPDNVIFKHHNVGTI